MPISLLNVLRSHKSGAGGRRLIAVQLGGHRNRLRPILGMRQIGACRMNNCPGRITSSGAHRRSGLREIHIIYVDGHCCDSLWRRSLLRSRRRSITATAVAAGCPFLTGARSARLRRILLDQPSGRWSVLRIHKLGIHSRSAVEIIISSGARLHLSSARRSAR